MYSQFNVAVRYGSPLSSIWACKVVCKFNSSNCWLMQHYLQGRFISTNVTLGFMCYIPSIPRLLRIFGTFASWDLYYIIPLVELGGFELPTFWLPVSLKLISFILTCPPKTGPSKVRVFRLHYTANGFRGMGAFSAFCDAARHTGRPAGTYRGVRFQTTLFMDSVDNSWGVICFFILLFGAPWFAHVCPVFITWSSLYYRGDSNGVAFPLG